MLKRPQVDLVNELHRLGRHLAVLKRIYQSYDLIVTRILKRQRLLREEARIRKHGIQGYNNGSQLRLEQLRRDTDLQASYDDDVNLTSTGDAMGIELSFASAVRFERLSDRIRLYALSEIEECITEKESLTFLVCQGRGRGHGECWIMIMISN